MNYCLSCELLPVVCMNYLNVPRICLHAQAIHAGMLARVLDSGEIPAGKSQGEYKSSAVLKTVLRYVRVTHRKERKKKSTELVLEKGSVVSSQLSASSSERNIA